MAVVLSALNQDLENLAFMIHCAPQVHMFAGDPDHNLVEMPSIARDRSVGHAPAQIGAIIGPNLSAQLRTLSYEISSPRLASSSSTSR